MIERGPSESLGTGMGAAWGTLRLAAEVTALGLSAAGRGLTALARSLGEPSGDALAELPDGSEEDLETWLTATGCAVSTARCYRQLAVRFGCGLGPDAGPEAVAEFLARLMAEADSRAPQAAAGVRHDPLHRGLFRTAICALRRVLESGEERPLTGMLRLPPRAPAVAPAAAATVAALRGAARAGREELLLVLACDLDLRPGQMVRLRREDFSLGSGWVRLTGRRRTEVRSFGAGVRRRLRGLLAGLAPEALLFPSPRAAESSSGPAAVEVRALTVRAVQATLTGLVRRAGAPPGTTFTALRRAGTEARRATGAQPAAGPAAPPRDRCAVPPVEPAAVGGVADALAGPVCAPAIAPPASQPAAAPEPRPDALPEPHRGLHRRTADAPPEPGDPARCA